MGNLKPEAMANSSVGLDYRDLVKDSSGVYPPENWNQCKFASIITYPIPNNILKLLKKLQIVNVLNPSEANIYGTFLDNFYRALFSEKSAENMSKAFIVASSDNA